MYGNTPRDNKYTTRLLNFLNREYGLSASKITPAKRGYYGETWRVDDYFIKLDYSFHKEAYCRSFPVLERIIDYGINCVSAPVKTINGALYLQFDNAVLGVFRWINGDNIQNEETKFAEYNILAQVYTVPNNNLPMPHITFDTGIADLFFHQLSQLDNKPLLQLFDEYKSDLLHRRSRLEKFARLCETQQDHFYITHGDAGGNIIKSGDKFYLVDWDDPVIAPPERDAWFCMNLDWATQAFNNSLANHGISYTLRPERLAFFCYHMYFAYLTFYMNTYFELGAAGLSPGGLRDGYFENWIKSNLTFADAM